METALVVDRYIMYSTVTVNTVQYSTIQTATNLCLAMQNYDKAEIVDRRTMINRMKMHNHYMDFLR